MRIFQFSKAMSLSNKEVMEKLIDNGYDKVVSIQENFPSAAYGLFDTTQEEADAKLKEMVTAIQEEARAKEKEEEEKAEIEAKLVQEDAVQCLHSVKYKCAFKGACPYKAGEGLNPSLNCNYAL